MTEQNSLFPPDNKKEEPEGLNGEVNLKVKLGNIELKNPLVTCSGTFSYGELHNEFYDVSILGAITTKSYSLKPKEGNRPPRICETVGGVLNSIGLQNDGIDVFVHEHFPRMKDMGAEVILSIFGENPEEFKKIALKILDIKSKIVAVELNLSCPNVEKGGIAFASTPDIVERIVDSVKSILNIPLITKLSPNSDNLIQAALASREGGADAVAIVNTLVGTAVDIETFRPKLGNVIGGLSGPAIKPVALAKVYSLSMENILPIIGMGGIFCWQDALEFMIMGASAVGIGTINLIEYDAGKRILEGIAGYMKDKNIGDLSNIIGKVRI